MTPKPSVSFLTQRALHSRLVFELELQPLAQALLMEDVLATDQLHYLFLLVLEVLIVRFGHFALLFFCNDGLELLHADYTLILFQGIAVHELLGVVDLF